VTGEQGGLLAELAMDIERSMAESVSRRWLSFVVHRLAPDAPIGLMRPGVAALPTTDRRGQLTPPS